LTALYNNTQPHYTAAGSLAYPTRSFANGEILVYGFFFHNPRFPMWANNFFILPPNLGTCDFTTNQATNLAGFLQIFVG